MSKSDEAKAREHRLAAKLRENLKRRKKAKSDEAGSTAPPLGQPAGDQRR